MPTKPHIVRLLSVKSTNTWCESRLPSLSSLTTVSAFRQSAGRGQRGNRWESAAGKNLTFSLVFKPRALPSSAQFAISEAVALGIRDYLADRGITARIKWPNDIYVGDGKICGILVSHVINADRLSASIIGIGLNVNQTKFASDAPNPVSIKGITGRSLCPGRELKRLEQHILPYLALLDENPPQSVLEDLRGEFTKSLYRLGEEHTFEECIPLGQGFKPSGHPFTARITGIDDCARLVLQLPDGSTRRYAFKEIRHII